MPERIAVLQHLIGTTVENVLLSMEAEGVLLATPAGIWRLFPPPELVTLPGGNGINPVGCGDALVGGFCQHWVTSRDMVESARWGLAAAHVNLGKYEVPSSPLDEVRRMARQVTIEPVAAPVTS
jgi:fructose-1-phosphate kinase PfkB-like protein